MRHHTGEHSLEALQARLRPVPWPKRRTVENVLFALVVVALLAGAVSKAHHALHRGEAATCRQGK